MVSTLDSPPFLLVANHVALELVNTVNGRPRWNVDYLPSPTHVAAWAEQLHLASATEAQQIAAEPPGTDFHALLELRELLYQTFTQTSLGYGPAPGNLRRLFTIRDAGFDLARWDLANGRLVPTWAETSLRTLRFRINHEALQLLLVGDLSRTRACAGCGWLFLDTSKGGARKWCTMNLCGAKDKMRRYRGAT